MLEQLYELLEKIEKAIGNEVSVTVRKRGPALEFRAYWPDGYRMSSIIDILEVNSVTYEDTFVSYFIHKAKEAHPTLAPYIS